MKKLEIIKKKMKSDTPPYSIQNNAICFLPGKHAPSETAGYSLLGRIQDALKKWGWLYYGLTAIFKPVWVSRKMRMQLDQVMDRHGRESFSLNLGSGPKVLKDRSDIINVDIYAFDEVDMVADAVDVPLQDGVVDLILNQAMLEHVKDPSKVVQEMYRLLRPGGEVFCYLPFIVPFHAAPHDYYRWTMPGVMHQFRDFDEIDVGIGAGPVSGMLWIFQEWLATLLSFGSKGLHDILFLVIMVLTSPIKLLDILMVHHPYADKIASGFYVSAKK